ncbi:hypothetical protein KCM76_14330 [Zooshikella marina]|uniref:hypothetical protein n=1 Tax=Zooshikella ganghwensis TaxID=202772 RepID=UPI001BAF9E5E|nr:hypothetical protein [Zooshikella ganghwensis]MBU2707170.1 hypothetical protein [Zooshikella ganghwensis]
MMTFIASQLFSSLALQEFFAHSTGEQTQSSRHMLCLNGDRKQSITGELDHFLPEFNQASAEETQTANWLSSDNLMASLWLDSICRAEPDLAL